MESQQYIDDMKDIQYMILNFLEDETNDEENFVNLENKLSDQKIIKNRSKFKSLLYLISNIGNNHYRNHNFFSKLEKIIQLFKEDINKQFTNSEIFNIFYSNMRLLLFLFDENILIFDLYIVKKIATNSKYLIYFTPEAEKFPSEISYVKTKTFLPFIDKDFYKLRKIGENDNEICQLIRNDMVKEFIIHVNRNNILTNATIEKSQYETNPLLHSEKITLVEYAAFFGSIQIFTYLLRHDAILNSSIWLYAIHGKNAEIIHELECKNINLYKYNYLLCLKESIKCHHNDVAYYFLNNFLECDELNLMNVFHIILQYYNFEFMKNKFIDENSFYDLCQNDYISLVNILLKTKNIDINAKHKEITYLFYAVEKVHIEIIDLLIKNEKLDINLYNTINYDDNIYQEKTALHLAVENGNIEIVKLLLTNKKIDINMFNKKYNNTGLSELKTALYLAVEHNNIDIINLLLKNDTIDINILNRRNDYLETALYLAVDNENIEIIKLLLENSKIDINIPSEEIYYKTVGNIKRKMFKNIINTPLHAAVEHMDFDIVELLLKKKDINLQIKDYNGKTPIECTGNDRMIQLFPH